MTLKPFKIIRKGVHVHFYGPVDQLRSFLHQKDEIFHFDRKLRSRTLDRGK